MLSAIKTAVNIYKVDKFTWKLTFSNPTKKFLNLAYLFSDISILIFY